MRKLVKPMERKIPISFACSNRFALIEPCNAKKHKNIIMPIMMKKIMSRMSIAC